MPATLGWKLCRQFRVGKYAGNFGLEIMPAISGRKICLQFLLGKYAGNFGSENSRRFWVEKSMPAMSVNSGRKKIPVSLGRKKKCWCFREGIKLPENLQVCLIDWKNRRPPIQEMGKHIVNEIITGNSMHLKYLIA